MATQIKITKWCPEGFAECLNGMDDMVRAVAESEAAKMGGSPGEITVDVTHEPRFRDSQYGVSRPIAVARIKGDAAASADEAENKTMSKAVGR